MSSWTILLPVFIGCIGILQGALNSQIAATVGVAHATLLTNVGTVAICIAFYAFVKNYPQFFPEFFQVKMPLSTFKWWYIFPPLFGFTIIAGMPFAITQLGAVKVTVGLIAAQMITSVVWDIMVQGIAIDMMKFIGIIFAFLSVTFITFSKQ